MVSRDEEFIHHHPDQLKRPKTHRIIYTIIIEFCEKISKYRGTIMINTRLTSPSPARPPPAGVVDRKLSRHGLNLALKAVRAREVREESQAASAAVAARLGGQLADRDDRVTRARGRERVKRALQRAARPEVIYGDAVKEANLRGINHQATSNRFVPSHGACLNPRGANSYYYSYDGCVDSICVRT